MARVHHFHAEAHVFDAHFEHPLTGDIKPQNHVKLLDGGGYILEHTKDYRADNIVTFKSAHTHVAGHPSPKQKEGRGWITLATSVIEGLNVMEVVTADRVVAQTSTEHPRVGHVPTVTFLGTRFENLRIAGFPVRVSLKFPLTTIKPSGPDDTYLGNQKFLDAIGCENRFDCVQGKWATYLSSEAYIKNDAAGKAELRPRDIAKGTLAYDVFFLDEKGQPTKNLGGASIQDNVITVPDFGRIFLSELAVECDTFHLTMIRVQMGSIGGGSGSFSVNINNGGTYP